MTLENSPDWRALFQDVEDESDKEKLTKKLDDLEATIFFRFQDEREPDAAEVKDLKRAIDAILRIKVEKLGYPMDSRLLPGQL